MLIRTHASVISAGTEKLLQDFGHSNWIERARQQPDKVKQALDKIRTDGILPTLRAINAKLDRPIALGYCNAGEVLAVGENVQGFKIGDRVASNGPHAGFVGVPKNLCVKIPDNVDNESAAFTALGAIALQGIRLANPTLGESIAVIGLGLIGQLTIQLLIAQGCRVLGVDFDSSRVELARKFGATCIDLSETADPTSAADQFSRGQGLDAVLITAATQSNQPVHQAARMCRKRGRIVLVGLAGLELSRADFYDKELSFQVSCSYGPGRYDTEYEQKGHDYPVGFVRWTEQRNFEAVLDMLSSGRLNVSSLITHRFDVGGAPQAYEALGGKEPSLGIVLRYSGEAEETRTIQVDPTAPQTRAENQVVAAFIGTGNHAVRVLIPAFSKADAELHTVASVGGVGGVHAGRKFGFKQVTTDLDTIWSNDEINTVVIATRHDSHTQLVCQALKAGKHVYVEKPLALSLEQLAQVKATYRESDTEGGRPVLMVGFNRRYAPQIQEIKKELATRSEPKAFVMTINAGAVPADHWVHDPEIGGGRIIGEACHFLDLLRFLAGSNIVSADLQYLESKLSDSAVISLKFGDGSVGTIQYLANGHRSLSKERLEVFCGGGVLQLDNFKTLKAIGWPGISTRSRRRQDKGSSAIARAFCERVGGSLEAEGELSEMMDSSRLIIELATGEGKAVS